MLSDEALFERPPSFPFPLVVSGRCTASRPSSARVYHLGLFLYSFYHSPHRHNLLTHSILIPFAHVVYTPLGSLRYPLLATHRRIHTPNADFLAFRLVATKRVCAEQKEGQIRKVDRDALNRLLPTRRMLRSCAL